MRELFLIIRREYLERVAKKSFIIVTIVTPILMIALMMVPTLVMMYSGPESKTVAVIDHSGVVASALEGDSELKFVDIDNPSIPIDSLSGSGNYQAILIIGEDVVDNPSNVKLYSEGASSMQTEMYICDKIENRISMERMKRYDIENLDNIMKDLDVSVRLSTYRLDTEEKEETSSFMSYGIGMAVSYMLFMFLLIYGQMVMTSIIEEKNNRVLEIVVSSVKPTSLMLGKIIGVGLVALTQIVIWGVLIGSVSAWFMPIAMESISDPEVLSLIGQFADPAYILSIFGYIVVFLVLGYLFYSSVFAAIGSAVDNVQDASQLTTVAMVPIMLGMIFSMTVAADPNSSLAFWLSEIPFTSPMVMMARIPFGIPAWEIVLSVVLLSLAVFGMIWLCAKIYRVGIFMYGKKPSFKELVKWTRYK